MKPIVQAAESKRRELRLASKFLHTSRMKEKLAEKEEECEKKQKTI
jgi:hypothetical protein